MIRCVHCAVQTLFSVLFEIKSFSTKCRVYLSIDYTPLNIEYMLLNFGTYIEILSVFNILNMSIAYINIMYAI